MNEKVEFNPGLIRKRPLEIFRRRCLCFHSAAKYLRKRYQLKKAYFLTESQMRPYDPHPRVCQYCGLDRKQTYLEIEDAKYSHLKLLEIVQIGLATDSEGICPHYEDGVRSCPCKICNPLEE